MTAQIQGVRQARRWAQGILKKAEARLYETELLLRHPRSRTVLARIAFMLVLTGGGVSQKRDSSIGAEQQVLRLKGSNKGQPVNAKVGQAIEITLQTIGPGRYPSPQVSSGVFQFEGGEFLGEQNPGRPRQVYRFPSHLGG